MPDSFVNQFIDDYYAECDEHLVTVRRVLMTLDEERDRASHAKDLAELARALHTLKGLSGMVGYGDAERVAHLIEDWVAAETRPGQPVSGDALEGLFAGTRLLESCIVAHRTNIAAPDIDGFATRVSRPSLAPVQAVRPADARTQGAQQGQRTFECEFTPDAERAARGITVESVRTRLASIGTIERAAPRMLAGGKVAFSFMVALAPDAEPPQSNPEDGIVCTEVVPEAPVPSATSPSIELVAGLSIVRVDLQRLDELMRLVGDLVITRGRVAAGIDALDHRNAIVAELSDASAAMERQLRDLGEAIMHVRMVAISEIFERMRYAAREVAREAGKQVAVVMTGQDTEIDKMIVERMLEPLLHLVRNAVSHGLETPAVRSSQGKAPSGQLDLRARTAGERIIIEVEDDGAGLDYARIAARAREAGIITDQQSVDSGNVLEILSAPGFSTHEETDMTRGRGVGMAVVRQRVQELGGQLSVASQPGKGTRFTIRLPLTLMIVDAILFRLNGGLMAAPQPGVIEVLQVERAAITTLENNEVVAYRNTFLPLFHLRAMFGLPSSVDEQPTHHALVINTRDEPIGLIVDRIVGQREIVVRALADPLVAMPGLSGATELSNGTVALIIDTTALAQRALRHRTVALAGKP